MPESDLGKLDYHVPVARAEVNVTGAAPAGVAVADDGATYHALPPAPVSPPRPAPPPQPTESEFRAKLAIAIAHERETADRLTQAKEAADRAQRHLQEYEAVLREFDGIEAEIATNFITQITAGHRPETTDQLRERADAQAAAHRDYIAANAANVAFQRKQAEAQAAATEASAQVERHCGRILGFEAERIAEQHAALLAEAAKLVERLAAFDQFATRLRLPLSTKIRHVLGNAPVNLAKRRDVSQWTALADALRADPQAEIAPDKGD